MSKLQSNLISHPNSKNYNKHDKNCPKGNHRVRYDRKSDEINIVLQEQIRWDLDDEMSSNSKCDGKYGI